eukprot:c20893_g1_i1.p1 GENE.c20893_g1_i1~~c20893_g1_i1.p1  ORF type:complete len:269 (+),score=46.39 c20893_g1_i1:313-1119(+)
MAILDPFPYIGSEQALRSVSLEVVAALLGSDAVPEHVMPALNVAISSDKSNILDKLWGLLGRALVQLEHEVTAERANEPLIEYLRRTSQLPEALNILLEPTGVLSPPLRCFAALYEAVEDLAVRGAALYATVHLQYKVKPAGSLDDLFGPMPQDAVAGIARALRMLLRRRLSSAAHAPATPLRDWLKTAAEGMVRPVVVDNWTLLPDSVHLSHAVEASRAAEVVLERYLRVRPPVARPVGSSSSGGGGAAASAAPKKPSKGITKKGEL